MLRFLVSLSFCFCVSGCSDLKDVFLPISEKVNKAFPLSVETRIAEEEFRLALQADQAALKSFQDQYASRLELRALSCTLGLNIGRFESVAKIKALPLNRDCLTDQDSQIRQFLGVRQVGIKLSQSPLRPMTSLGPAATVAVEDNGQVYSGFAASNAGVAVLQNTNRKFVSIEIPGGKKIANFQSADDPSHIVLLSPNGRLTAIHSSNRTVTFFDSETGAKLWTPGNIRELLVWLPEISAALVLESKNGSLSIIDFETGKIESQPIGPNNPTWGLYVNKSPSRVLIGSQSEISLIKYIRSSDGVEGASIKEFRVLEGRGVTSTWPTLMLNRTGIVFISSRDFMKIDLESGKQTLWSTGDFLANRYSKLSETALLVDSYQPGGLKTRSWLFDVEKSTLAPVEGEVGQIGILANLDGRTGFMRRGNRIWFGDELEAGEPVPLEKVLSSFNLERQLAKIEAETRALESANGIGSYDPRTSRITNSTPSIGLNPLIAGVANQAQIEAIGVYQGGKVAEATIIDGRKAGEVVVQIHRSAKPIVLVLSSYEPVKWTLRAESGTKLAAVLLSGYYRSEVVGAGSARVFSVGRTYAYKLDSAEYNKLNLETTRLTGKGIGVFQGRYEGGSFSIGG